MSEDSSTNNSENSLFSIEFTPQLLILSALGLLALIMVCIFGVLLFDPVDRFTGSNDDSTDAADSGEQPLAPPVDDQDAIVIFDGANSLSIDVDPPTGIDLDGTIIPARAQFVTEAGEWTPQIEEGRVAEWVYGTVVNPVFGLSGTSDNELLLQKLVPGDTISINYGSGDAREYLVSGRELLPTNDNSIFTQNRPGITLIWLGDAGSESRLVVYGDYTLPDTTTDAVDATQTASLGEPVPFGNLVITAVDSRLDGANGTIPPGFSVLLVDYVVANNGNNVIDSGLMRVSLKDQQGNLYASNGAANINGSFPNLTGFINPGDQRQATAAFQIPTALSGDSVEWNVSRVDVPGEVTFSIPFSGGSPMTASVVLSSADVSPEGSTMIISGSITNGGTQAFQLTTNDVSLEANGTVYLVFSTTPGFPWNVPPGQTVSFSLSFQRPQTSSATFRLAGNSFELDGIR